MDALYDVVDIIPSSQTSGTGYDSTEASTDDGTKAGGVHIPPRTASSSASNKIVTEKTCYDFFCKFRKNDLDKIRKGCNLNVIRRQDDFVEVRFNEARTGTCAEWKRQFSAICDELKLALVVERVEFSEVENVNKLLSKLKSQAQSLLIKKTNAVDIVCRREALEGIKDIIGKHKVKKSKQRLSLPVGYDVNGACRLYIYVADITKLNVDVIVNVTDEFFQLESGTSKAIAEAAGPEMDKALREYTKKIKLKTSDVFSTTAGNLRCKAILHAVKPRWPGDSDSASTNKFKKNLTTMFQNVLTAAATTDKEGCENVALSTSDFHLDAVPSEIAANALKDAILKTVLLLRKSKLKEVHVVDNQADLLTSVVDLLGDGGSIKISYGKSISIKTLSEDETQAGVAASSAEDSSTEHEYAVVIKPKPPTKVTRPVLPVRQLEPKVHQQTRKNQNATYENISPPVPRKNANFTKELKIITRVISDVSGETSCEKTNKMGKPEHAEEELTRCLSEDEDEGDTDYLYDEVILVDAAKAERREIAGDCESSVNVDRRYYNYLSKFRKKELDGLRKACHLSSKDIHEGVPNVLEIRFSRSGSDAAKNWQQQFTERYEELKSELTIERVALPELEHVRKLLNKLKSHAQVLLIKDKNVLDIVCRREALEGIKDIIGKHKVKKSKQRLSLPVGYDVNGACRLYIYVADITKLNVDVIVNVTDEFFQPESGTSKAIAEAAGPEMDKALREMLNKTEENPSDVICTKSGNLPCKAVVHALLPKWHTTNQEAEGNAFRKTLKETFENILTAVVKERYRNLAIVLDNSSACLPPVEFVIKAMADVLLLTSSKHKKSRLKEIHVVNQTDDVISVLMSQLQPDVLHKTAEGEEVTIHLVPESETHKVIANRTKDSSGQAKGLLNKRLKPKT